MLHTKPELYYFLIGLRRITVAAFLLQLFLPLHSMAQSQPDFEEVPVYMSIPQVGNIEIPSLIRDQTVYLPVSDLFDFLKVVNSPSAGRDSISGFFINQPDTYLIDKTNNLIRYKDKVYPVKPEDLIKTNTSLYLNADYMGKIFGLYCIFSFRNLSVIVSTSLELPVMREMRQAEMRNNLSQLKGEIKVDTTIKRTYPLFHFGTADWSVINTQEKQATSDTRVVLGLGGVILGGETNVSINYHSTQPLQERDQYYLWRLANNDSHLFKQVMAGKIFGQSTASIFAPIVGAQVTNAPTTYRRSFGTYTLSNTTQPNWIVELYVNNTLVSYVRADASGYYTFEVPLVYGSSLVKLKFYGPLGEERTSEQNISIPFNFLPKNEFEYTASAGIVEDGIQSKYSRFSANYGLTKTVTVGGGTEYLSSVTSGPTMPFINSSARLFNNLLLSGEYTYGVRTKGILSYRLPSGIQLELNDTWYKRGQTAINNTYLEERKAIVSAPFRGKNFSAYTRITVDQITLPTTRYTTTEWLVSGVIWNLNANINNYALFTEQASPYIYTNLSVTAMILKNLRYTQQVQYEYVSGRFIGHKEEVERRLFKNGFLNLSYERNIASNIENIEFGIRYDFSMAQTGASVRKTNNSYRFLQYASGSLVYDQPTKYLGLTNHTSVGKGGITVVPYLDLNYNGQRDPGEPAAEGLRLRSYGGRIEQNKRDTTIRIMDLEPYVNYILELDPTSFENISWQLKKHNFSIAIDPNKIKIVEVPVTVVAEASGKVSIKSNGEVKGQGRIIVNFYRKNEDKSIARTVTEGDGYFSYMGLIPGDYMIRIDTAQLMKLNLKSIPEVLDFNVKKSRDGAVVDGLDFILTDGQVKDAGTKEKSADSLSREKGLDKIGVQGEFQKSKNENQSGKSGKQVEKPEKKVTQSEFDITLQVAHLSYHKAKAAQNYLVSEFNFTVVIKPAGHSNYNVIITGVDDIETAKNIVRKIKHRGFPDAFIFARRRPPLAEPQKTD
ncbi:hypothetical protein HDF26_004854 [Pedobacter cryoconitis]|uniref:hypothetical protein n=1 Tax=Pedobacter cryoconitis TaxID=188932 RepID=UPI001611C239|nr:hypothetical protein [Pedobacter cryoconitis]MBB6274380.1 hypothetical protein [Pedobacter cryoconitis]